jgi:hypothetical protein
MLACTSTCPLARRLGEGADWLGERRAHVDTRVRPRYICLAMSQIGCSATLSRAWESARAS